MAARLSRLSARGVDKSLEPRYTILLYILREVCVGGSQESHKTATPTTSTKCWSHVPRPKNLRWLESLIFSRLNK